MRHPRGPTPGYARALCLCACLALPGCSQQPRAEPSPVATAAQTPPRRDILGKKLAQKKTLFSQHNEELVIRDFFQDRRGGFFLDVGCAWPKKYNNTYFLESELGWSGIGVDALPEYAQAWKTSRRNSRFFNYMVTDHSGSFEKFFRAVELPGISSVAPRKAFSRKNVKYEEIRVPTITLTKLLDDAGIERIDLLSMDIEGHEPTALAGFDIDRFRPELVCIEVYHAGQEKLRSYFADHGYERIERYVPYDGANQYFAPKAAALAAGLGR